MKSLGSDTMAPAMPEILEALARANADEAASYGEDELTARATQAFSALFDTDVTVRWALGGTGANVVSMAATTDRHEGIVLADIAHMVEHECGAAVQATGAQFMTVPTQNGKMLPETVRQIANRAQHSHFSRPSVISITQATEIGTVYSVDEMRRLTEVARELNMFVHVDGARVANAMAHLDVSVKELFTDTGVDIISFGGTKGGTMFGEAVVILDPFLADDIYRTQLAAGQLSAKTRFIAAQFEAFLADDLWLRAAQNANDMARLLSTRLEGLDGFEVHPSDVNMVFADVRDTIARNIRERIGFQSYDTGSNVFRWVAAWDTTEADIDELVNALRNCAG
jgi:threonine aldolase